ncbi:ABC transporter permease [Almyronema epifaneia]|uniref:Transport permease protein n=1 Tax=Almyronema epifaneia S1 TaxID=2991925 RepID=A0ABW6IBZ0_9CYAN
MMIRSKTLLPLSESQWTKLELLKTLVQREMEARYKGSILGNLWPLLNQLAQLFIYTYVFSIVLGVKLDLKGMPADNSFVFGLWLFSGLLLWITFSNGLTQASGSVIGQPNLVKKVVFPLTLLPLVPVCVSFLESTFGLMVLITFVAFVNHTIHPSLLLLPLIWLPQLLLTAGLGFLAAGLTVFIRDIPQTLGVVLNLWFYATPLIYPAELIPQPFQKLVFWLNPLAAIGELYRDVILIGSVSHWGEWFVATGVSCLIFLGGFWCYRKLRPAFADVL